MKLLLTGATGFLGSQILSSALKLNYDIAVLGRTRPDSIPEHAFFYANIDICSNYITALQGVDVVIHSAARVHIMKDEASDPLTEFRKVNTDGTLNLARQAARAGVKRFVFISSIKVNGEQTCLERPFTADDVPCPQEPYAISKAEAEAELEIISQQSGMEVVIIRPPLVYGPGVKANFASLMNWVYKGLPLPFGAINENKRSLVSVDNLVCLIITCVEHPNAANQVFLVSDGDDVSTTQLLKNMAGALGVMSRLLPIPVRWFTCLAKLIGKPEISQRLCGSLQVDISKTKEVLNWEPRYSSVECMKKTAIAFLEYSKN